VNLGGFNNYLYEKDEQTEVWLESNYVYIPELNINVNVGTVCEYDEELESFEPDFSLYFFFNSETQEFTYNENSSLEVCISNYLHISNSKIHLDMEAIENLECEYVIVKSSSV
jgi:hypothetical protein